MVEAVTVVPSETHPPLAKNPIAHFGSDHTARRVGGRQPSAELVMKVAPRQLTPNLPRYVGITLSANEDLARSCRALSRHPRLSVNLRQI